MKPSAVKPKNLDKTWKLQRRNWKTKCLQTGRGGVHC